MRRLILVAVIALFAGMTIVPALGGASAASPNRVVAASKQNAKQKCTKPKSSKSHKGSKKPLKTKKGAKNKKTPTSKKAPKKKKAPKNKKASKNKKTKSNQCSGKAPSTKKKTKKSTPSKSAVVPTATDTPTETPTDTPTVTATATQTPTPAPSVSTLSVRGDVQQSYLAAFFVCGLPTGVTASFSPNPAVSRLDTTSPALGGAYSSLIVSTRYGTLEGAFSLALHAYYEDRSGNRADSPPGGGAVEPRGATLNVDSVGNTSVTPLPVEPAVGFGDCTSVPAGFAPSPTATPSAADINVMAWVSDAHPSMGERESVFGQLLVHGKPISVVLMHTHWFFPDAVRSCDGVTDSKGMASCAFVIPAEPHYQTVKIQVTFEYNNQEYTTYTSFMT